MSLVFNIPSDYISGYFITYTSYKVTIVPEFSRPKLFLELRVPLEYLTSRYTFYKKPALFISPVLVL